MGSAKPPKRLCRFHGSDSLLNRPIQILNRGTLFEQAVLCSVMLRHLEQIRVRQMRQHDDGKSWVAAVGNELEQNMKSRLRHVQIKDHAIDRPGSAQIKCS